ncbi:MerR family transcriptional regulator [Shimazuella alba]|uniref:MerR family transcriptional regulator n=1 Tax=Shimazuella alba TaxID=2690964 RepID=A0A6I4VQB2_9BACL|nr:MerR family transcriptional regulator [Shimazuella alba]MXQ52608.1 MerR family transcriptional regulator [Shimazuella alba]
MQISELAQKTGVSLRSLRYYEEKNLLNPIRLENGYRQYREIDIKQIQLIQLYLSMGLSTTEIADLFNCTAHGERKEACIQNGIKVGEQKISEIRDQIEVLRNAEAQLIEVVADLKSKSADKENL